MTGNFVTLSVAFDCIRVAPCIVVNRIDEPEIVSMVNVSPLVIGLGYTLAVLLQTVLPIPTVPPESFPSFVTANILGCPFPAFSIYRDAITLFLLVAILCSNIQNLRRPSSLSPVRAILSRLYTALPVGSSLNQSPTETVWVLE